MTQIQLKKELDKIGSAIKLGLPITDKEQAVWRLYGGAPFYCDKIGGGCKYMTEHGCVSSMCPKV